MRIAISASGPTLDDMVDPRFGRCPYFIIIDTDTMQFEAVPNPSAASPSGAGIQAAQFVVSKGVQAVVSGNVGPNSSAVLQSAGVQIIPFSGRVRDAVEAVKSGNYPTHPAAPPPPPPGGFGGPGGPAGGWGPGGGRGGWGRGGGRGGWGRGGGRGPGGGRGGKGGGWGRGGGRGGWPW